MRDFLSKKNIINLLLLGIMVLAIPLTIKLVRQQQILFSRAQAAKVDFLTRAEGGTDCVINRGGNKAAVCNDLRIRFTSPTGDDIRFQGRTALLPQKGLVSTVYAGHSYPTKNRWCMNNEVWEDYFGEWDGNEFNPAHKKVESCGSSECIGGLPGQSGFNEWAECQTGVRDGTGGCCSNKTHCGVNQQCTGDVNPNCRSFSSGGRTCINQQPARNDLCPTVPARVEPCSDADGNTGYKYCEWKETGNIVGECSIEACAYGGNPPNCNPKPSGAGGSKKGQRCDGYPQLCTGGQQWCEAGAWKDDAGTDCGSSNQYTTRCVLYQGSNQAGCNVAGTVCYVNGGYLDPASADNGCKTNHPGSPGKCDQSNPGPYGDGCVGPGRTKCPTGQIPIENECKGTGLLTVVPVGQGGCCNPANRDNDCNAGNKFGARQDNYSNQPTTGMSCTDINSSCQGGSSCKPATQGGFTGAPGTGGCCDSSKGNADCKASNSYGSSTDSNINNKTTEDMTCSVRNTNCQGSGNNSCYPSSRGGTCVARFQRNDQDPWEQTKTITKGGSIFAGALTTSTPTQYVDGATLTLTGSSGTTTLQKEVAYTPPQAGSYTLTANGGGCVNAAATLTVNETGNTCFTCSASKQWTSKQCPTNPPTCDSNSTNTYPNGCTGGGAAEGGRCGGTASPVITKFRFAENPSELAGATVNSYQQGGVTVPHTLSDTLGEKSIWYQFGDDSGNWTAQSRDGILLVGPDPVITGSSCNINLDIKDGSLLFRVQGDNFGSQNFSNSRLSADNSNLEIREWTSQRVMATMVNPPDTTTGKTYGVVLTRSDGVSATATCRVNTTQISFGAKLFCRAPSNFDQDNVSLTIVQNALGVGTTAASGNFRAGDKARETVAITKEGVISNLKTKLQEGLEYIICIKAPKSLRICTNKFTAVSGNNIIQNLNLPIGDVNNDELINSVDAGICKAEWGPAGGIRAKACEFNRDNVTNSFEWSCLLHDFNAPNQPEP